MSEAKIHPIVMPKWGLSMTEGRVDQWLVDLETEVSVGDEILDVETDKIASAVEATNSGVLRRTVASEGEMLPVGALLGVLTEGDVADAEVDAFVEEFQASFVPPSEDEEVAESSYRFVEAGGHSFRYAQQGESGEAVVLVHGFGGDLDNWLFNLGDLAEQRIVYALDLPGHGQSSKDVGDGSLDGLAQALGAFMDVVGIDGAHLVGHSVGGAVVQHLALNQPSRALSLTLIASAGLGSEINSSYIDGFIESQSRRDTKTALENLYADTSLVSRQMLQDILKYKRLDGVTEALQAIAGSIFGDGVQQHQFREDLAGLSVPVQVIWGSADRIIPAAHAGGLPDQITVVVLDGHGHMVQMEAANQVNKLLQDHFAAAEGS